MIFDFSQKVVDFWVSESDSFLGGQNESKNRGHFRVAKVGFFSFSFGGTRFYYSLYKNTDQLYLFYKSEIDFYF